jgi:hypothetical protein
MNTRYLFQRYLAVASAVGKRLMPATASCVMLGASMTACAAVPTYNPDHLQAAQFERVSDICQNVMGLRPNEPLKGGDWLGQPRIDYDTSHYRVCIISLSDAMQNAVDTAVTQQADADCRAKGLAPNSSDLALCVLKDANDRPASSDAMSSAAQASRVQMPQAASSYHAASPHEKVYREQVSCAALGLEPSQSSFHSCVTNFNQALYAIDNPMT